MNLDLTRLKALAKATAQEMETEESSWPDWRIFYGQGHGECMSDFLEELDPATVIELIRRAERAEELERWYANTSDATATKEPT